MEVCNIVHVVTVRMRNYDGVQVTDSARVEVPQRAEVVPVVAKVNCHVPVVWRTDVGGTSVLDIPNCNLKHSEPPSQGI